MLVTYHDEVRVEIINLESIKLAKILELNVRISKKIWDDKNQIEMWSLRGRETIPRQQHLHSRLVPPLLMLIRIKKTKAAVGLAH